MKPVLKLTSAACLLALALPAQSQILWDTLVDNSSPVPSSPVCTGGVDCVNFYEDQNREAIFDIDGDGALSDGDVLLGYIRLDDRSAPLPGDELGNDLYGIFSTTVDGDPVFTSDGGDGGSYDIDFRSTTQAGLTLADFGVTNTDGTSFLAVFEDVDQNLISGSSGDVDGDNRLTIFDFILEITNDTQDLVAGYEVDGVDHWRSFSTIADTAVDAIADLTLLESATIAAGLPGTTISFHAGLGITWADAAGGYAEDCTLNPAVSETCFARVVLDVTDGPSLHELTAENGDISGAADLSFGPDGNPYFSGAAAGGTGQLLGFDFYGASSNADFGIYPYVNAVPEPSTLALIGAGLFGVGAARRRRKA